MHAGMSARRQERAGILPYVPSNGPRDCATRSAWPAPYAPTGVFLRLTTRPCVCIFAARTRRAETSPLAAIRYFRTTPYVLRQLTSTGQAGDQTVLRYAIDVLKEFGLPIARERSRSGNGAHLWFFFDEPHPARYVRDVLTYLLTLTMERNPEVGLGSYDRIFPNQDRLPKGGFGNLIALPLQGTARRGGNTCFVDDRLVPYPDQWKFLSDIPFVTKDRLMALRARAQSERRMLLPQSDEDARRTRCNSKD